MISLGQYRKLFERDLQELIAQLIQQGSPSEFEPGSPGITRVSLIYLINKIPKWNSKLARQGDENSQPREAFSGAGDGLGRGVLAVVVVAQLCGSRADARFLNPNSRSGDRHFNPAPAQYRHGAGEAQA